MCRTAPALSISKAAGSLGLQTRKVGRKPGKALARLPTILEDYPLVFQAPLERSTVPTPTTPFSLKGWPTSLTNPLSLANNLTEAEECMACMKAASQIERGVIFSWLTGAVRTIACSEYGSRVVQTVINVATASDRPWLVAEMRGSVLDLCGSVNGHKVLVEFVERMPAPSIDSVVGEMEGHLVSISKCRFGHQVLESLIMHSFSPRVAKVASEICPEAPSLCRHQYGSLVVQSLLEYGGSECQSTIVSSIIPQVSLFAMDRVASNVLEKALDHVETNNWSRVAAGILHSATISVADIACSRCGSAFLCQIADSDMCIDEFRVPLMEAIPRLQKSKFGRKAMESFGLESAHSMPCAAVAA